LTDSAYAQGVGTVSIRVHEHQMSRPLCGGRSGVICVVHKRLWLGFVGWSGRVCCWLGFGGVFSDIVCMSLCVECIVGCG
jgi:hypothetical protein